MWRNARREAAHRALERRMREELEAYAQLDATLAQGSDGRVDQVVASKALAMRVCRTIADKSTFTRVMVLLRGAEGSLRCMGSIGVDDLTVAAAERWAEQVIREERGIPGTNTPGQTPPLGRTGAKSVGVSLGEWQDFDREVSSWEMAGNKERRRWRRAIAMPIRSGLAGGHGPAASRLMGAIIVCADGVKIPMRDSKGKLRLDQLITPIEILAAHLGTSMQNEALSGRLLRAEKLAGLGQLAGGVAHALNNPLTAVLGFAELIAESSSEPRVQEDARTIATEALKMKETVQRLTDFWRPSGEANEPVPVLSMIFELADECREKLEARGVKLEVQAHGIDGTDTPVRGCATRLREMLEHLLNNAAQAISQAKPLEEGETHNIRVSVTLDKQSLHLVVSDTGTGFKEPGRAFDPFYTTKDPVEGAGMGLSICYGIVREHGGEIAAFNLHPHGAAVVIELPVQRTVVQETVEEQSVAQ
jgi:signal transduction histidine kinase